jgi:hypothetical protein
MFLFKPCAIKFWNKLLSSKLINLSFYMQGASARDLEMNIGSYCKFDSCQLYSWGKKKSTYCILWQLQLQCYILAIYTIPDICVLFVCLSWTGEFHSTSELKLLWTRTTNKRNECDFPKFSGQVWLTLSCLNLSFHLFVFLFMSLEKHAPPTAWLAPPPNNIES